MKKATTQKQKPTTDVTTPTVRLRHNRFDGFDIYTVESGREKILFHKPVDKKFIIADTFEFLGSKDNLWLCKDTVSGKIHIAPFDKFTQMDKKS